jgi:signal transduction histidine kinase
MMEVTGPTPSSPRTIDAQITRLRAAALLQSELAELAFQSNMDGLQTRLLQGTAGLLDSESAILILLDEENPGWLVYKSLGNDNKLVYHLQQDEGKGPVSDCLRTGQTICAEGEAAQIYFDRDCSGEDLLQARSLLCACLSADGHTLGAIVTLNKSQGSYSAEDQELIVTLARLAASLIHGSRSLQLAKIQTASLEAGRWEMLEPDTPASGKLTSEMVASGTMPASDAMPASRGILRALFDHLPAGLYIINPEYRLLAVNNSRAQRAARPVEALVGQVCYQALFNRQEPCLECRVRATFLNGQVTQRNERWRSSAEKAAEETTDWDISSYPILDEQGQVAQAILYEQDITEKRRLEAILTQSEKLAAVGQLAAGVAHEINNPLTAIIANAQILHRELPLDSDLQESVDLIARAGARAAQVVRNLLDFARKEEHHLGLTDVNETLEKALELVQHELVARGVHLDFDPDLNLPPLLASADHLQSVWLNLLLNAIDSLDKSPGQIRVASRKLGDEIHVQVTDNGKGVPADRLTRIFEPFYTTKAPGRGTGLGLSVSHRIVKQHGGHIRVESQVGIGSTFTVIIPAS